MKNKVSQGLKKNLPDIKLNVSLKNHTTFKIGGKAKYFFEAKTKKDLIFAIKTAQRFGLPFYILGGGSKLLISDKGFAGLVIKVKNSNVVLRRFENYSKIQKYEIFIEAGLSLKQLTQIALENNLTGMEWAAGIPGTVGGAVRGNAGAFGKSIESVVKRVEVFDINKGKTVILKNKDCEFEYRDSIFKKKSNLVVLSCKIQLKEGNKKKIEKEMKEYLNYRKKNHPLNFPSVGSIFENFDPKGSKNFDMNSEIKKFYKKNKKIPVGYLIEKCGLVGKKIGNVKISEKHSNFIINLGNGKSKDVKKLIEIVKQRVNKIFGVVLEEEIQYLNQK